MAEYSVRAAQKVTGKKHCVFKLHKDDQVTWTETKMRRENEYQPWQIKIGSGRSARRFKAIKEGGVGDNASYFIFYKPEDATDTYEVCSIDEWYSVSATQRYKTLTAEEAEQKFEERHKQLNKFTVMKSRNNGEAGEEGGKSSAFKISELDDWDQSGDDFDGSGRDDNENEGEAKPKSRNKKSVKKEKEEEDAPDEGKEDSDEGDLEHREVDYMSDLSSDSSNLDGDEKEEEVVKGIAEEEALRDLLSTDDEEEADSNSPQKLNKFNSNKNTLGTVDIDQSRGADGSDDSSDSEDYDDVDEDKMDSLFMKQDLPAQLVKLDLKQEAANDNSLAGTSKSFNGSQTNSSNKRKATSDASATSPSTSNSTSTNSQPQKKRLLSTTTTSSSSQNKLIEDLIKKYLRRKPTQAANLLKDIKNKLKRTGGATAVMDNNLVELIADVLKRLNPTKEKINNVTYFSLPN